jgi:hypothetical protein
LVKICIFYKIDGPENASAPRIVKEAEEQKKKSSLSEKKETKKEEPKKKEPIQKPDDLEIDPKKAEALKFR